MIELNLDARDRERLASGLLAGDTERCAVLFANQTVRGDGTVRLLVRDLRFATDTDYARRGALEAELKPEFVATVTKIAARENLALIFVHTHPGSDAPRFSAVDSRGEGHLSAFLERRHPDPAHLAMVFSAGGFRARRLGQEEEVRVISIGTHREILFDPEEPLFSVQEVFDRQVRAFGVSGQRVLQKLRIAIVGLGGTGSLVAQQLAHLGVRNYILVDPDVLEVTNLNRVTGATRSDVGSPKVDVAARYITSISDGSEITCVKGDVIKSSTARELLNADLIFGCTDSHGSRAVIQQVSYQYMVPCIDMGVSVVVKDGRISHIYGRVQLLSPGLACFTCDGLLDAGEVRRDMMTEFERKSDPYLQGVREPAPAVISLNGTVASLAVTMLLSITFSSSRTLPGHS